MRAGRLAIGVVVVAMFVLIGLALRGGGRRGAASPTAARPSPSNDPALQRSSASPASGGRTFRLSSYGALGNGSSNDTRAVQAALDAAARAGRGSVVMSRAGMTFVVSHLALAGSRVTLNLNGSIIKAAPSAGGVLLAVTGSHDVLENLTLDANHASSEALRWSGNNGVLQGSRLLNGPDLGLHVVGSGGVATSAVTATGFANVCFDATGGTLITHSDRAEQCGYAGFYFGGSSIHDILDGTTTQDSIGAVIDSNDGHILHFTSNDDNSFGLLMEPQASDWSADYVETDNIGRTADRPQGTGVELIGASHNSFSRIISNRNPGYAVALTAGSNGNAIGSVYANHTGAGNANPGLLIDTGSDDNRLTQAVIIGYSVCLHIGETPPFTPSIGDWIGVLSALRCPYDAIRIDYGNRNTIGKAIVTGCGAITKAPGQQYLGTVDFARASDDNTIGDLEQQASPAGAPIPSYTIYFAPDTRGNRVETGRLRAWTVRSARDDGHNYAPFNAAGNPTSPS